MNTAIIIPAYNAGKTLPELLDQIAELNLGLHIYIMDDGSDPPVDKSLSSENIEIIRNSPNSGKGQALLNGMRAALKAGYNYAVTIDADLQHPTLKIPDFLNIRSKYTVVLGTRLFAGDMPWHRRFSNSLTSMMISSSLNQKISDSQCGYRCYELAPVVRQNYREQGFMFESEVLLKTLSLPGTSAGEVTIDTLYPGTGSHIRKLYNTFEFCRLIIRNWFE